MRKRQPVRRSGEEYVDSPGRRRGRGDHGTPQEAPAGSPRGDRRAGKTQTVRIGMFGGLSTSRHDRDIPDISTRWHRR